MTEFDLSDVEQREIKAKAVTEEELQELYALTQSYEALFSKKSTQIKERNIDVKSLQEEDFKTLILEDYRFLKRPVFIINQEIFIGSDKKNVELLRERLK
jgi:arsenate reductase-like glutaredoxin family protein